MPRLSRPFARALGAVAVLAALVCSPPAMAAPGDPVIGLSDLRAEMASSPSGTLSGHMKTVLRGSVIENIPVEVLAVTGGPTDDLDPEDALVLFEARGAAIDRAGGIAAGMSGSPVYVNIRGVDRLVGALAYGESFARNGAALATPIEAMTAVETLGTGATLPLSSPVLARSGIVDRVVVTSDADGARLVAATGGLAVQPLSALYVGGIEPSSPLFRAYAAEAGRRGLDVVPLASALGTGNERFTAPFAPGAAVAALASRGDLWVGGIGTVTYTSGDALLAFGHPLTGEGPTQLYLSNAWIDGVWPSLALPHKLGTPGALRGTITQDRNAGIMGVTPGTPDEIVVTSHAHRTDTGEASTSRVAVTSHVIDSVSPMWFGMAPLAASVAPLDVYDTVVAGGSASTTTTVGVTNGTQTFTIVRTNVVDSKLSVPGACLGDLSLIVSQLGDYAAEEREPVHITSVELTSSISAARNAARVVDVSVAGGLRTGTNTVRVGLRQVGVPATRTVELTLTVPPGTPLDGRLVVTGATSGMDMGLSLFSGDSSGEDYYEGPFGDVQPPDEPESLADVVRALAEERTNDEITVSYTSSESDLDEELAELMGIPGAGSEGITAKVHTGFVVSGRVAKQATRLRAFIDPLRPVAGEPLFVSGSVTGTTKGIVEVWVRPYGAITERRVATTTVSAAGSSGTFATTVPALTKTARVRVEYLGDADSLNAASTRTLPVGARVSLSTNTTPRRGAPVTLTARVSPQDFGGSVIFERRDGRTWRRVATVAAPAGTASVRFTPAAATTVRARTVGSPSNAPGTSRALTIRPR